MKFLGVLIKRYILTLLTLILILCLTFYKPTGIKRTDTIVEIDKVVHFVMYFTLCAVFWYENFNRAGRTCNNCVLYHCRSDFKAGCWYHDNEPARNPRARALRCRMFQHWNDIFNTPDLP